MERDRIRECNERMEPILLLDEAVKILEHHREGEKDRRRMSYYTVGINIIKSAIRWLDK